MADLLQAMHSRLHVLKVILSHPLRQDGVAATLRRYAAWTLLRQLTDSSIVLPVLDNLRLLVPTGSNISTTMALRQIDPNLVFLCLLTRPGDCVVDVGANIGLYGLTIAAANRCHVIACEPVQATFAMLTDNVRLNALEELVELHNLALGAQVGAVQMTEALHGRNHIVDTGGVDVALHTLDDIVGGRSPVALKIDVEGYEAFVIRGAAAVLADPALLAVYIELKEHEDRYGQVNDEVRSQLERLGFREMRYEVSRRHLAAADQPATDVLFLRNLPDAMERIRQAPPLIIAGRRF